MKILQAHSFYVNYNWCFAVHSFPQLGAFQIFRNCNSQNFPGHPASSMHLLEILTTFLHTGKIRRGIWNSYRLSRQCHPGPGAEDLEGTNTLKLNSTRLIILKLRNVHLQRFTTFSLWRGCSLSEELCIIWRSSRVFGSRSMNKWQLWSRWPLNGSILCSNSDISWIGRSFIQSYIL